MRFIVTLLLLVLLGGSVYAESSPSNIRFKPNGNNWQNDAPDKTHKGTVSKIVAPGDLVKWRLTTSEGLLEVDDSELTANQRQVLQDALDQGDSDNYIQIRGSSNDTVNGVGTGPPYPQ